MNIVWLILYHLETDGEKEQYMAVAYAYKDKQAAQDKLREVTTSTPTHIPDGDTQYYTLMSIEVR